MESLSDNNDQEVQGKEYTRDELVFLSSLYEKADQHDESVDFAVSFIKLKPILSSEERQYFANSFKNLLNTKRNSLRYLFSLDKKEKKLNPNSNQRKYLKEIIDRVQEELVSIVNLIQEIIEDFLLPNSKKPEAQVFYMKLQGDYYRYKAEFCTDEEKEISVELAEQAYNEAYVLSEEKLPITSLVRIGLALNFSIFYYEEKGMLEEAIMIAKNCFEDAYKNIDNVEPEKEKDYILIVQLLKENTVFWNTERCDEEYEQ